MDKTIFDHSLGSTSFWTAAVRARESERADCLFQDPWAAALAGEVGMSWIATRTTDSVAPIAIRTRFFDDFLMGVTHNHRVSQVVILAAGLDTRAFRLNWPVGTRIFELDQADVLAYKEEILAAVHAQPSCKRHVFGVDLTTSWAEKFVEQGYNPHVPAVWLLEGFLFYLNNEAGKQLLDRVMKLACPGSWMGFDVMNTHTLTSPLTQKWVEMQAQSGAPWIGTMDDPAAFLARRGWQAMLSQAGAADANYGRWPFPVIPVTMPDMPHNWFVTARHNHDHNFG